MEPGSEDGKHLIGIDGFGEVIPGAGLDALFAVAFHGFGRDGHDRQVFEVRGACGWRASCRCRPFPAS